MADETIHLVAQDGTKIVGTVWNAPSPKAILPWIHGFAEHRKRYDHFANWMNLNGITVAAIDVRGHGDSDGARGHVNKFEEYFQDVTSLLHWVREMRDGLPVILGSHSHGGLICGRYLEDAVSPIPFKGAVFSAPFHGLGAPVPAWKDTLGKGLSGLFPKLAVPTGLDAADLSHSETIVRQYKNDPLVFGSATARWFTEATKSHQLVISKAPSIRLPTLVMQGLGDKIVSVPASRKFYDDLGSTDKKWIGYEGLYHEILNETDREKVYADMLNWIKDHI